MSTRTFALLLAIVFLLIGIAGFVPSLMQPMHPEHPPLALSANAGQLFGLFPVNVLHSGLHILFGLWGLVASRSMSGAKVCARGVGLIYIVLTVAGFIPGLQNGFGLVPIYGNDIWLHGAIGLIAVYFGWLHRDPVAATTAA